MLCAMLLCMIAKRKELTKENKGLMALYADVNPIACRDELVVSYRWTS